MTKPDTTTFISRPETGVGSALRTFQTILLVVGALWALTRLILRARKLAKMAKDGPDGLDPWHIAAMHTDEGLTRWREDIVRRSQAIIALWDV